MKLGLMMSAMFAFGQCTFGGLLGGGLLGGGLLGGGGYSDKSYGGGYDKSYGGGYVDKSYGDGYRDKSYTQGDGYMYGYEERPINVDKSGFQEKSTKGGQISSSSSNIIKNGNFQNPSLTQGFRYLKSLPGWQISQVEQGIGSIYNSRWGNTVVIELDGNQNDFIRQKINLQSGFYEIEFDYAARVGHIQTSALSVSWNGKKVQAIQASDEQIHHISIPVQSRGGVNTLEIRGEGPADTHGMTITNVQVNPSRNVQQLPNFDVSGQQWRVEKNQFFKNCDFESPAISKGYVFLKQMPGWIVRKIQQGIGSVYNRRWGNKVVIQLDATQNQALQQTLRLEKGVYRFQMNYAAREGYTDSAMFTLTLNDNVIQKVTVNDDEIHKLFFAFEVNEPGDFVFAIRGDGPSDSYGMTIGQVSLFSVQGQVKRVEKTQEIICYNSNTFERIDRINNKFDLVGPR